ncbi:MAG: hypothetical protein GJU72_07480 [Acidithiobacillus ferriphilus]|jgi:hypothetical protein|uniref:hypothetical protein n=1 Tax=Acidithiobacillus ferriphilus TaxID=1689834 RepID=UPI00242AECF8|nr:hypothetical protein [Acidithiobacillus ferriphilus]MBW9248898.1 hypothetical protein [Acidithiobacillus ferriphilus]MBW9254881.1 hypothetical protein [Acidithiobacillus ferriphilus]
MKTLYLSHGDKGGCGKSVLAMLIVEHLLAAEQKVHLVESDPSQPDLAARYADDPEIVNGFLSLNKAGDSENAVSKFNTWLEDCGGENVVVNLPAGASETLDSLGDLLLDVCDTLGYRLVVTYSLEKNGMAANMLEGSIKNGLMSVVAPENRFVVYPRFKGEPGDFSWFSHPARDQYDAGEIVIPEMKNTDAWTVLEATPGRLGVLSDKSIAIPSGWRVTNQASVFRFYKAAMDAIAPLFIVHEEK